MFATKYITLIQKELLAYEKTVLKNCISFPDSIKPKMITKENQIYFRIYFDDISTNFYIDAYARFVYFDKEEEVLQGVSAALIIDEYNKSRND